MSDPAFLRRSACGVTVDLRVQPRARRTGLAMAGDTLKAAVNAPPEGGKANDAVIALLAEAWRLPRSSFEVVKGHAARSKTVRVSGAPATLAERVSRWIEDHG